MSNWRPDGWKNPFECNPQDYYKNNDMVLFESGADAMLEALESKQAIQYIDGKYLQHFGSSEWIDWNLKGLLVFIPDQKPPDSCNSEES